MKVEFWSSSEYSGFMLGLLRELRASGLEAVQQSHIKEATYRKSNTRCARMLLRCRQYVVYPISLLGHLLWRRLTGRSADFVVISTNTFYAPLLATWLHPQVVHLVYDLFPEALIHSGKLRAHSPTVRLLRWITARTMQRAAINVFLGERLLQHAQAVHPYLRQTVVIPVGADQSLFPQLPVAAGGARGGETAGRAKPVQILYCGNIGNLHDTDTVFAYLQAESAATMPASGGVAWAFRCSGPKYKLLERFCSELPAATTKIELGCGLQQDAWVDAMAAADVALVTMVAGSETVVLPSKAYSAMMAGQALLVVAPAASDLVDLVKRADCGWWVEPGDVSGFSKAVAAIASDPSELRRKQQAAVDYARAHLSQRQLAATWKAALAGSLPRAMPTALRIWIFNPFDEVPGEGHSQRYSTLAQELAQAGHEVVWWSSDWSHRRKTRRALDPASQPESYQLRLVKTLHYSKNVSLRRLWSHSRFGSTLRREAVRAIRSGELAAPDIILASSPPLEGPVAALKIKQQFHCRVITDLMDLWPKTLLQAFPGWFKPLGVVVLWPYYRMLRRACQQSDALCAQSESFAALARSYTTQAQPYVCYLGALSAAHRTSADPATAPRTSGSSAPALRLLCLGAMGQGNDLATILAAVELLANDGHSVECVFVGDGEKRAQLQARQVPGVRFTGYLQGDALAAELCQADLGIIPFFPDSGVAIPYKAGDYLAYGLPMLSTLGGELAELMQRYQCGLTYTHSNPESLAAVIREYLNDPQRIRIESAGAKACFAAHFDHSKTYPEFAKWIVSQHTDHSTSMQGE